MSTAYSGYPPASSQPGHDVPLPQAPPYPAGYPTQPAPYPTQPAAYPTQPPPSGYQPPIAGYQPPPPPPPQYGFNQPPYKPVDETTPTFNGEETSSEMLPTVGFSEKSIRRAFVRKVFAILTIQLAFTAALTALFIFEHRVKRFVQTNLGIYISAYVTFFVLYLVLCCCPTVRRKYPTNMILLSLFTIVMGYMVATISSFHDTDIVFYAAAICLGCTFGVIIFSFHTKFDFTSCGGFLFVAAWGLFIFGFLCIFTYSRIMHTVYAGLGALVFICFLAYDTQMIMGGKKYSLSPEEHIFAALQLYLDVIYIFLFILSLLGGTKK